MTKKILLALAALTALTLCFSSCKKDNNKPTPKSEVKLRVEPKEIKVIVGQTAELTVTVEPADTKCTFETANADIATVSDKGVITGVKVGKTVITVKAGDATPKTVDVEVIEASSMDTNSGIGDKDKDVPHFIFIPADKSEFKKDNLEVFKTIMTAAGWIWDQETYDYKDNKDKLFPFSSPEVKNEQGQDVPKFLYHNVNYMHKPQSGDPFIACALYFVYEKDPLAPENQAESEEEGFVSVWKSMYGFDQQSEFTQIQGMNAWVGFNTTAIKGVPLQLILCSYKLTKDDVGKQTDLIGYYQIITQISYAKVKQTQMGSLPIRELRNMSSNTPLRAINR